MSAPRTPSRRRVLTVLSAAGAATCLVPLAGCASGPSGLIPAGNIDALAVGDLSAVAGMMVAIGLDAGGLYAVTTICTHLDCDMSEQGSISATELVCDCHGSVFDGAGGVVTGPATQPLEFFAVEVDAEGEITIDADSVVDASERVTV